MSIAERLEEVRGRIARAAARAGRRAEEIELVVVTKTHPPEALEELFTAWGEPYVSIGENRVQELIQKMAALHDLLPRESTPHRFRKHMIGHLQRNKVRQIIGYVHTIQSVDSSRLIEEIEKEAVRYGLMRPQRILLELNLAGESSKTGARPEDLPILLETLARCPHVRAQGLMTVPPYDDDPEKSRPHFARLRQLLASIPPSPHFEPRHLSMGMSGDFEVAIEEGATIVRVGTAIMGERSD